MQTRRRPGWTGMGVAALLLAACGAGGPAAPSVATPTAAPHAAVSPTPAATGPVAASTPSVRRPAPPRDAEEYALLRVVSKQAALGASYVPEGLVTLPAEAGSPGLGAQQLTRPAAEALAAMQAVARAAGLDPRVQSAYRSFAVQQRVHAALATRLGEAEASRRSAPAGYSEHQLGTTADLTSASAGWGLNARFASTAEGVWLDAHAHQFGFARSYPEGGEAVTGYVAEPWHYRYIGVERAVEWRASGLVLVEYLVQVAASR